MVIIEQAAIAAGTSRAVRVEAHDAIAVINTHGNQVVDAWALSAADHDEYLSVEHTKAELLRLVPHTGDILYSNRRNPLLTLVKDTSPGRHDMQRPACDFDRYRVLGFEGRHANCHDNFLHAMWELGVEPTRVPNPLNVFQNMPWTQDGRLPFAAPVSRSGDRVTLRAEIDLVVVMSACPQDVLPVNRVERRPSDVAFEAHRTGVAEPRG